MQKIRLIFVPFVKLSIAFVIIYSFLHWQFFLRHPFDYREEIVDIWIPIFLPFLPVLIWLRPKILLLDLKTPKGNLPVAFCMIAALTISITTIIAQKFIETAMGKLTQLESIAHIGEAEPSKYYSIKTHYSDKQHICFKNVTKVSGKGNRLLTYYIYIACPVYDSLATDSYDGTSTIDTAVINGKNEVREDDNTHTNYNEGPHNTKNRSITPGVFSSDDSMPKAWLCFAYKIELSNKLPEAEKNEKWNNFFEKTYRDFYEINIDSFVYAERLGNNKRRDNFSTALTNCGVPVNFDNSILLEPFYEPFEERNGNKLAWVFGAFGIGAALFLLLILNKKIREDKLNTYYKLS